jgi:hypothetical protein
VPVAPGHVNVNLWIVPRDSLKNCPVGQDSVCSPFLPMEYPLDSALGYVHAISEPELKGPSNVVLRRAGTAWVLPGNACTPNRQTAHQHAGAVAHDAVGDERIRGIHGCRRNWACSGWFRFPGSHELCFSNPKLLAQAIMDAGRD